MITSVEVFEEVKEMSRPTLHSNHRILLSDIAENLLVPSDTILLLLVDLENSGLVKIDKTGIVSVSLTNYDV